MLLYAAPIWSSATGIHLKKCNFNLKFKFVQIILGFPYDTKISTLYEQANMEYIETVVLKKMIDKIYEQNYETPLISRDYNIEQLLFKVKYKLCKSFYKI